MGTQAHCDNKSCSLFIFSGITFGVVLVLALLAFVFSALDQRRGDDLKYVNLQIEKLYGPLYALTQADNSVWVVFKQYYMKNCLVDTNVLTIHKPETSCFNPNHPPTADEVTTWRVWMREVFEPLNVKMENVILANPQLVIGNQLPRAFLDLISHTEGYKAVISRWNESEVQDLATYQTSEKNIAINLDYPDALITCVEDAYSKLKERKESLEYIYSDFSPPAPLSPSDICGSIAVKRRTP
jgi:hypothetical protein